MAGVFSHVAIANAARCHHAMADPNLRRMLSKHVVFRWFGSVSLDLFSKKV